jgi:hypothetical protein
MLLPRTSFLILILVAVPHITVSQTMPTVCLDGSAPHYPGPPSSIDQSCNLPGLPATPADKLQNLGKNNFCPVGTPINVTTSVMNVLQAQAASLVTAGQPPSSRNKLVGLGEGKLATFEGFVMKARQECKESVNCGATVPNQDAFHDIHISLLDKAKMSSTNECTSFVAEMVPHHRPSKWNSCNVNSIAALGLRVRITGQLLFDGSHEACSNGEPVGSNPKRSSLWEIHPIYTFEVCPSGTCTNGGWKKLEEWSGASSTCQTNACQ